MVMVVLKLESLPAVSEEREQGSPAPGSRDPRVFGTRVSVTFVSLGDEKWCPCASWKPRPSGLSQLGATILGRS